MSVRADQPHRTLVSMPHFPRNPVSPASADAGGFLAAGHSEAAACELLIHRSMTGLTPTQPVDPWADFATIPGLGAKLTDRLIHQLGIQTLEQLELAAHTGRLRTVLGIGPRKACAIGRAAAELLVQRRRTRSAKTLPPSARVPTQSQSWAEPAVAQLLIVDREYRRRARAQTLPKVAPRRFNPEGTATLPVYRVQHGNTEFRVFHSNSPTAHALSA